MKKLLTVTTMLFVCIFMNAQAPQGLNYQAVARTADGVIIPTQNIGVRFSILDGSVNGTVVYSETHTVVTNSYGLFTLAIGKGTPVTSTFPAINWASGTDKFLKVEIAPAGGSNYQLQGTTQLLSVPYALYSEKTRLLAGNNTINITNGNTITGNYQAANNTILLTGNAIAGNYQAANNTVLLSGNTIAGNYQAGNNTILLNGNTITGNYQPANNTILLNGNSIAGNYQAANNTVLLTGNTIAGNYQAGTGINLTGNTISHNLVAGSGISISGNVITNTGITGTNHWVADPAGIHNQSGYVGIRTNSASGTALTILQDNSGGLGGFAAMDIVSGDTWQTVTRFRNTSVSQEYQFNLAGSANIDYPPGSFGVFHATTLGWLWYNNPANDFIGIGSYTYKQTLPKSRLHVFNGDVNIDQIGSGIILKSPNGNCWRVTIDNTGNLVRTAITCPN